VAGFSAATIRHRGSLGAGRVSATRSAVAAMSAAAAARPAGAPFWATFLAQPGCAATRRHASWTTSACLARAAGGAPPSASTASAAVSWAARRAGPPPITGTALAGPVRPGEGRGRDGTWDGGWVLCPALAGLGPGEGPPPPAAAHPVTGPAATAQAAASRGSRRSRTSREPGTAFNPSPARGWVPALARHPAARGWVGWEAGRQAGSSGTVAGESTMIQGS